MLINFFYNRLFRVKNDMKDYIVFGKMWYFVEFSGILSFFDDLKRKDKNLI